MFTPETEPSLAAAPSVATEEQADFEFVLGRRQIASLSLVGLTLIGAFTAGAYMIGKSTVPTPAPVVQPKPVEIIAAAPVMVEAPAVAEIPVFGIPEKNERYLQLASVERGFAVLMVQGARKQGYPAIVAAGTNPNVFRVLVGPLKDQEQYQSAKTLFTSMGLEPFARKYGSDAKESETTEP
ncbi:MAG: hypothetical protein ABIR70_18180 [Bryobacteraceae bacterium]